jgi:hypothetical protein
VNNVSLYYNIFQDFVNPQFVENGYSRWFGVPLSAKFNPLTGLLKTGDYKKRSGSDGYYSTAARRGGRRFFNRIIYSKILFPVISNNNLP